MYGEQLLNTHKLPQTVKQVGYLVISFRQNPSVPNIVANHERQVTKIYMQMKMA